jgi:hypothetical protein
VGSLGNSTPNADGAQHTTAANPNALPTSTIDNGSIAFISRVIALATSSNTDGVFQWVGSTFKLLSTGTQLCKLLVISDDAPD